QSQRNACSPLARLTSENGPKCCVDGQGMGAIHAGAGYGPLTSLSWWYTDLNIPPSGLFQMHVYKLSACRTITSMTGPRPSPPGPPSISRTLSPSLKRMLTAPTPAEPTAPE